MNKRQLSWTRKYNNNPLLLPLGHISNIKFGSSSSSRSQTGSGFGFSSTHPPRYKRSFPYQTTVPRDGTSLLGQIPPCQEQDQGLLQWRRNIIMLQKLHGQGNPSRHKSPSRITLCWLGDHSTEVLRDGKHLENSGSLLGPTGPH